MPAKKEVNPHVKQLRANGYKVTMRFRKGQWMACVWHRKALISTEELKDLRKHAEEAGWASAAAHFFRPHPVPAEAIPSPFPKTRGLGQPVMSAKEALAAAEKPQKGIKVRIIAQFLREFHGVHPMDVAVAVAHWLHEDDCSPAARHLIGAAAMTNGATANSASAARYFECPRCCDSGRTGSGEVWMPCRDCKPEEFAAFKARPRKIDIHDPEEGFK